MENKRKLFREYKIYVYDRLYEISHTFERMEEITNILMDDYGEDAVTVEPYNHYLSGWERKRLEGIIAEQLEYYAENGIYQRRNFR